MVKEFLAQAKISVDVASFDVAGPVIDGRVKATNLPWMMDEDFLANDLNLKAVHLMNDLEAVARAVLVLRPADLLVLNEELCKGIALRSSSQFSPSICLFGP
jgi:glucokinase